MRRVLDDGETGLDTKILHLPSKFIGVRGRVVRFSSDKPAGWIFLVKVLQRRCEAISRHPLFLCAAKEMPPDLTAILDLGYFASALRHEIRLCAHGLAKRRSNRSLGLDFPSAKQVQEIQKKVDDIQFQVAKQQSYQELVSEKGLLRSTAGYRLASMLPLRHQSNHSSL